MADAPFTNIWVGSLAAAATRVFVDAPFTDVPSLPPAPVAPVISNFAPTVASALSVSTPISFDVTDNSGLFSRIIIVADFPNLYIREVIHDGTSFGPRYRGSGNGRTAISGGFHYSVLRDGGWPASPTIVPYAIDQSGTENV